MKRILAIVLCCAAVLSVSAKEKAKKAEPQGYVFTEVKSLPATSVKNQASSGTCWCFSGLSFLECEILRNGGKEVDLSEMWIVRNAYLDRAKKYVRMHGKANCAGGSVSMDVINAIKRHGIVPESVYTGLEYGTDKHKHAELDALVKAYVDVIVSAPLKTLTPVWKEGLSGIFDAYLGEAIETFEVDGKSYTPQTYASSLGLNLDDYISLTSYTHHPFYEQFALEVPDNWDWNMSYNIPLDEFMQVCEDAINGGYTVLWASDVSDKGFSWGNGVAIVPEADTESMEGTELAKWVALSDAEKQAALYKFDKPGKEKTVTQQMRQQAFDNYDTTDDHAMLITGLATDQNGNKYFKVKNSWGADKHKYNGYFYASFPYVALRTTCIMINKNALSQQMKDKLGIE